MSFKRPTTVLILFSALLFLSSCGKKEERKNRTPSSIRQMPMEKNVTISKKKIQKKETSHRRFEIRDIDRRSSSIEIYSDHLVFQKIRQPIVLLEIFSDWCIPCRGMLPYLGRLQKKNARDLFVIGLLVRSDTRESSVRKLMQRYDTSFFLSVSPDNEHLVNALLPALHLPKNYPLPLTLLYKNGKYVMQISGAVPYEMLQNLVDQLKDKRKD
ncbi:TlpA family protein disulfide reductase [Nitratifractor sp.]